MCTMWILIPNVQSVFLRVIYYFSIFLSDIEACCKLLPWLKIKLLCRLNNNTAPTDRSFLTSELKLQYSVPACKRNQQIWDFLVSSSLAPHAYTKIFNKSGAFLGPVQTHTHLFLHSYRSQHSLQSFLRTENFLAPFSWGALWRSEKSFWAFSEMRRLLCSYFQLLEDRNSLDMQTTSRLDASIQ